jgi:hypothetical protein
LQSARMEYVEKQLTHGVGTKMPPFLTAE